MHPTSIDGAGKPHSYNWRDKTGWRLQLTTKHQLTPVPFTQVHLDDAFWGPRMETNCTVTIPAEYRMLYETGRINSFDLKWKPGDPNPPHIFWDATVGKWIEAASYSLATRPDSALDAQLDWLASKISHAQQPDGYLNTHFQQVEPEKRWTNLRDCHELYCAGHLIEASVAHYQATGKRALLDVLCRYADLIDATFGISDGKKRGYCGHEEIELALIKLYHAVGNQQYLKQAQHFIDERGREPNYFDSEARARGEDPADFWAHTYAYMQAHIPVRQQTEVTGHAVRAMYLYCALADLANELEDEGLFTQCERLWEDACLRRMYITGGIGASMTNEGFTQPYDLPDETAYAETCAAVGFAFWNHRMLQFEGDRRYADVIERILYNGALSGVSLDGRTFFYVNPLASDGHHHRKGWYDVACCPTNIARLLASIGNYVYSQSAADAWIHLYVQGSGSLQIGESQVILQQITRYPWDGDVRVILQVDKPALFKLHLRLPGWCQSFSLSINDHTEPDLPITRGYIVIEREWRSGDAVTLKMDMPVQYMQANPNVSAMRGRLAMQRGPVVYCLEGCDHPGLQLDQVRLRTDAAMSDIFHPEFHPELLGGVVVLHATGTITEPVRWDGNLYQSMKIPSPMVNLTAIPYYAWDNRAPGEMRVWFHTG